MDHTGRGYQRLSQPLLSGTTASDHLRGRDTTRSAVADPFAALSLSPPPRRSGRNNPPPMDRRTLAASARIAATDQSLTPAGVAHGSALSRSTRSRITFAQNDFLRYFNGMHPESAGNGVSVNRSHIARPRPVIATARAMPVSNPSIAWSGPQPPAQRVSRQSSQRLQRLRFHPGHLRIVSHF